MATERYAHGTICKLHYGPKKPGYMKDMDDSISYVYIDSYKFFNTYRCYPCNSLGEVEKDAKALYINQVNLIKYTAFPRVSIEDLSTLADTLSIFSAIINTESADYEKIIECSYRLSTLSHKLILIKNLENLP